MTTTCDGCGTEAPPDARFCRGCGKQFVTSEKATLSQAPTLPPLRSPDPSATSPVSAPTRRRRGPVIAVAVVAGVLLLGLGVAIGLLVLSDGDDTSATPSSRPPTTHASSPETNPTTTTTATTTTTIPTSAQRIVELAQQWVNALADEDWETARAIDTNLSTTSDATLFDGYRSLQDAQIVLASVTGPDSVALASVADEDVGQGPRTNVYCYMITAAPDGSHITPENNGRGTPSPIAGFLEPAQVDPEIATCRR